MVSSFIVDTLVALLCKASFICSASSASSFLPLSDLFSDTDGNTEAASGSIDKINKQKARKYRIVLFEESVDDFVK